MSVQRTDSGTAAANNHAANPAPAPPPESVAVKPGKPKQRGMRKIILYTVLAAAVIAGSIYGYNLYSFGRTHVSTDDAQIDGHINPVLPHIAGYVTAVAVNDNDIVKQGATIVEIDPRELEIKLGNAEAALRTAQVGLETAKATEHNSQASIAVSQANVRSAELAHDKATNDLARDRNLLAGNAITQQQFDATKATFDATAAQLETARRQVQATQAQAGVTGSGVQAAASLVSQRQNDVEAARLQLTYTKIVAPTSGKVSKKNVEVGQFVQAGQPLLAITEDSTLWVTANFKETDMEMVKVGAPVEIEVDGYPDVKFTGRVESIAAATGAKFSLLPPDNATGNFVKVTQRIPVKIAITGKPSGNYLLRPGMSTDVTVTAQ